MENLSQNAQLVNLTNSAGWALVLQLATQSLAAMERRAIDCDDEKEVLSYTRRARGAREFWDAFCNTIDELKAPSKNSFVPVIMD